MFWETVFQTLKGSLQTTLPDIQNREEDSVVSNPQRISTNIKSFQHNPVVVKSFKPSKDLYKHLWGKPPHPLDFPFVSNPQRISTNLP
ncbi:MAG: hypothetical protein MjAS7_1977 [Metallosphaera javensis (ex Sakai et al. 2022)]|nr:MAG: hypothetical protein MjAS7_1977 [Metallosphaera javensis (ex Sakai et al. 2022)]